MSGVNPHRLEVPQRRHRLAGLPRGHPNQDGAGIVDAVGPGVPDLAVGDRVWTCMAAQDRPTGTAQEFTVLPAERVTRLPDGASFDVGASLGVPAVTAHAH